jgi:hypothetical protein
VKDIIWNNNAFKSLVLPEGYKDLVLSFTRSQNTNRHVFDDVIEGKGICSCTDCERDVNFFPREGDHFPALW